MRLERMSVSSLLGRNSRPYQAGVCKPGIGISYSAIGFLFVKNVKSHESQSYSSCVFSAYTTESDDICLRESFR